MLRIVCLLALALTSLATLAFAPRSTKTDGGWPVVVSTDVTNATPGQTVTFTVVLDGPADAFTTLSIDPVGGDDFAFLPFALDVPLGATEVKFNATVGSTPGEASLVVCGGGEAVEGSVWVVPAKSP